MIGTYQNIRANAESGQTHERSKSGDCDRQEVANEPLRKGELADLGGELLNGSGFEDETPEPEFE